MLYIILATLIINTGTNANRVKFHELENTWTDGDKIVKRQIFPILENWLNMLGPIFGSSSTRCATYEGYPGTCKQSTTKCPNLGNGTKTSCILSFGSGTCCPTDPNTGRTVMPRTPSVPCGDRNLPSETRVGFNTELSRNEIIQTPEYMIVGGIEAQNGSWPWAIQLMFKNPKTGNYSFICGGSIINELYILCAAHCVLSQNPADFKIKIGAMKLKGDGEIVDVDKIIVHESYQSNRHQNDISLFKLKQRINWRSGVAPVCLPTAELAGSDVSGKLAWLVGWGTTSFGGNVSNSLREVQVPIVTNARCAEAYDTIFSGPDRISERQICAGYEQGGKDTCQGDSGGPLMIESNGKIYQMGIVSYGNGCAKPKYPGVYTRVPWFLPWLGLQMENDFSGAEQ